MDHTANMDHTAEIKVIRALERQIWAYLQVDPPEKDPDRAQLTAAYENATLTDELRTLWSDYLNRRNSFLQANFSLVAVALRGREYTADDFQAGFFGLLRALDGFDVDRGVPFASYAIPTIRSILTRAKQDDRFVAIPYHRHGTFAQLLKARNRYYARTGSNAPTAQLADEVGVPVDIIEATSDAFHIKAISTDTPIVENLTIGDTLPSDQPNPEQLTNGKQAVELARDLLSRLPPREQKILCQRYGLDCAQRTLVDLSREFNVSRQRILQIQRNAEQQLRAMVA